MCDGFFSFNTICRKRQMCDGFLGLNTICRKRQMCGGFFSLNTICRRRQMCGGFFSLNTICRRRLPYWLSTLCGVHFWYSYSSLSPLFWYSYSSLSPLSYDAAPLIPYTESSNIHIFNGCHTSGGTSSYIFVKTLKNKIST